MMMDCRELIHCAFIALDNKIPFALYALPGESGFTFFANPSFGQSIGKCSSRVVIAPWLEKFDKSISLENEWTPSEFLENLPELSRSRKNVINSVEPYTVTLDENLYVRLVSELITRLKQRGGKTVFSRTICGDSSAIDFEEFTAMQFSAFPKTFRFLYYTPLTGAWLGTSPEILLDFSNAGSSFRIMSLAGTRRISEKIPWDPKNIAEQGLVAHFIGGLLRGKGIKFRLDRCADVEYPPVCHICDIFSGKISPGKVTDLLDDLNPTPALGGYPTDIALHDIEELEPHPRRCYGGYVAVVDSSGLKAYVNLRCVNFSKKNYCIYVGGGITAASNPGNEWRETLNKTEIMRQNLLQSNKNSEYKCLN